MLSQTLQDAINEQIKAEFYSAHLYLAMSSYFESRNLPGMAHWMRLQYEEELAHGRKFFDYILERGGQAVVGAIDQPAAGFESPLDAFQRSLSHEQKVTGLLTRLYELALSEHDYPTQFLLQWYINEQVEEERNVSTIVETLKGIGPSFGGLMQLDHRLAKRGKE